MKWYLSVLLFLPIGLAAQNVGVNINNPIFHMDVRAPSNNELAFLNVAGQDNTYFTRLIAGHAGDPASSLSWRTGSALNLGMWDADNFAYSLVMHLSPLNRVGINTFDPEFDLDVRGLDDTWDGGELQLATPGQTNFLRFFGGRLGDQHPFMAFTDTDTFHIVSTAPDWSTFSRKVTILPTGEVGIGTDIPLAKLDVESVGIGKELLRLSTERPWVFRQTNSGAATQLSLQTTVDSKRFEILSQDSSNRAAVFHVHNLHSNVLLVPDGGEVGVGVQDPSAKLHIMHNSNGGWPNLRVTEDDDDYARIKFDNTANPGAYWDLAAWADTITDNSKLNFYFNNGINAGDRMTITGIGDVGIGITSPSARLDILGGDWNLGAGNAGDLRIGNATHNLRIGVATGGGGAGLTRIFSSNSLLLGTDNLTRLAITSTGEVGIGTTNPSEQLHVAGTFRVDDLAGTGDRNVIVDSQGKFKIGTTGVGDTDWNETGSHVISQKTARVVNVTGSPPFTTASYIDISAGAINKWSQFGAGSPYGSSLFLQNDNAGGINMVQGGGNVGIGTGVPTNRKVVISGNEIPSQADPYSAPAIMSLINTSGGFSEMLFDGNEISTIDETFFLNKLTGHDVVIASGGGDVGIGTNDIPAGYRMSVAGKIIAEELRVQLQGAWPDYVFKEDYPLMSIDEVETAIKAQGHLPGIPSASHIETTGMEVGDMQAKMMEKIEELTLYVIQLNQRIGDLEHENAQLQQALTSPKK